MKPRNRCKGIVVTLTTPHGTYDVRLPKSWAGARRLNVGERIRPGDRVMTAQGDFVLMGDAYQEDEPCVQHNGNAFPVGYYYRNTAARSCRTH